MLLGCQVMYGKEWGDKVRATIEEATGQPCPCSVGRDCPLFAQAVGVELGTSWAQSA